jgi:hypothetical protein
MRKLGMAHLLDEDVPFHDSPGLSVIFGSADSEVEIQFSAERLSGFKNSEDPYIIVVSGRYDSRLDGPRWLSAQDFGSPEVLAKILIQIAIEEAYGKRLKKHRQSIGAMLDAGEGQYIEFKREWSVGDVGPKTNGILKSICGFLNGLGGTVIVGISDDKEAAGLTANFLKDDGLELQLRNAIRDRFVPMPHLQVTVTFPSHNGVRLARIDVTAGRDIYHLDHVVYLREGNQTMKLSGPLLTEWITRKRGR